jgi:hypothetical protein
LYQLGSQFSAALIGLDRTSFLAPSLALVFGWYKIPGADHSIFRTVLRVSSNFANARWLLTLNQHRPKYRRKQRTVYMTPVSHDIDGTSTAKDLHRRPLQRHCP